jgi:hypothetical protein
MSKRLAIVRVPFALGSDPSIFSSGLQRCNGLAEVSPDGHPPGAWERPYRSSGWQCFRKTLQRPVVVAGAVLTRALRQKDGDLALKAIARMERQLESKARLLGDLEEGSWANV